MRYSLVMKITPDPTQWERTAVDRETLSIGDELEVAGYVGRWRVISPHVPEDATDPEPNTFDCEPIMEDLPPPIIGGSTDRASLNLRETKHPPRPR